MFRSGRILAILCCLGLVGLTTIALAGPFRRRAASNAGRRVCAPCAAAAAPGAAPAAAAPTTSCVGLTCPRYIFMHNGSSCKWVAWQCNAALPHTEVYWIGSCDTPASHNPCGVAGGDCDNCFATHHDYVSKRSDRARHPHVVSPHYMGGIKKNEHTKAIFMGGAKAFKGWGDDGKLVKIKNDSGGDVFIRIWKVQVTKDPNAIATVGHEVPEEPGAEAVDQPAAPPPGIKIIELQYKDDQFTVILDPDTKLPE